MQLKAAKMPYQYGVHGAWCSKRRCSSFEPIFWSWVDISNGSQPKVELMQNYAAKKPFCLIDCVFNHITFLPMWIPEIRVPFLTGFFSHPTPKKFNRINSSAPLGHSWCHVGLFVPQHVAVPAALFVPLHVRGGGVWRPRCGTAGGIGEALPKASTFIPSFGMQSFVNSWVWFP